AKNGRVHAQDVVLRKYAQKRELVGLPLAHAGVLDLAEDPITASRNLVDAQHPLQLLKPVKHRALLRKRRAGPEPLGGWWAIGPDYLPNLCRQQHARAFRFAVELDAVANTQAMRRNVA